MPEPPQVADTDALDPAASARAAGLRYLMDTGPGIRRVRSGRGFRYVGPDGATLRDPDTLGRIRALAIPPAWTDVWISPSPRGHLQATGLDARGRKQYRYHARWREVRDALKYDHLVAFAEALPRIRESADRDLERPGMPREKVLGAVVRLLEQTRIRVGNEQYRRENRSFGLTTLRNRHVAVIGPTVRFHFRGKGGKDHNVRVTDRRLVRLVKRCLEIPGYALFQYLDENGERHAIDSADVNEYLKAIGGGDFTAKDFRTWSGTVLALRFLRECEPVASDVQSRQQVASAITRVAEHLGNTPAVCRKCYVHPAIVAAYFEGRLAAADTPEAPPSDSPYALSPEEQAVLAFLRTWVAPAAPPAPAPRRTRAA
jgi:DNA topoisomerase-1